MLLLILFKASGQTEVKMSYRYLSPFRPLGSWVFLEQNFSIESPLESDVDPFRPDWRIHDVLVTETPLPKEKIESLQLIDLAEALKRKALCDTLDEMDLNVKAARVEAVIKDELWEKIKAGKIKNETVLNKMVEKHVNYANSI
jgi:hypothetical protein